jgi:heme exporter protein D
MQAMDNWDVTLLIVAGYVAVVALVRLMARHRNQMLDDMRRQIAQERKRKQAEGEEDMRKSA